MSSIRLLLVCCLVPSAVGCGEVASTTDGGSPGPDLSTAVEGDLAATPDLTMVACRTGSDCPAGGEGARVECCGNVCVDVKTSNDHCGLCGLACGQRTCCAGSCSDTSSDPNHCGGCGKACTAENAAAACQASTCGLGSCLPGWGDCDADASNGCETNLRVSPDHCTACGKACDLAHGVNACANGCYLASCEFGWDDCNGEEGDGCETSTLTSVQHCGGCGSSCGPNVHNGVAGCENAMCVIAMCNNGFADCDGDGKNGCEADLGFSNEHCGKCGVTCDVMKSLRCKNGMCQMGPVYSDWLVGTPCNGKDYGGGCTPQETGYHYKGEFDGFQCWWHTKNQAWNTSTDSNIYQLAKRFGLDPATGRERWCEPFANRPAPLGYSVNASYNSINNVGAWGWCGGAPFQSGGWVCIK